MDRLDVMDVDTRIALPGFGLPVTTLAEWDRKKSLVRFPHGIADYFGSNGITLRERRMLQFMDQISDKPEWERKVFNEEIVGKWKEEAVRWDDSLPEKGDFWLSENMFECCIKELREKAQLSKEKGFVAVLDAEATIVKSDSAVPRELRDRLREAVRPLEDVPGALKDWHPHSGEQVLDLVHPSLFPIVYGLSRAMPMSTVPLNECISFIGRGETIQKFTAEPFTRKWGWGNENEIQYAWGGFQWLPSNISLLDGKATIDSYINNLHPRHAELYNVLEHFVDASIPLWNECLSWFHSRIRIPIGGCSNEDYTMPEGVKFDRGRHRQQDGQSQEGDKSDEDYEMTDEEWAWENDCIDEYWDFWRTHRILDQPEPRFNPRDKLLDRSGANPINLKEDFSERGIQVIFKLANIHLTPEEPEYDGGSWHVEGSLNEHICATAIYYYDSENVTDSHLAFRQSYDTEAMTMMPAQSEYESLETIFGVEQEGSSILELGSVLTRQDRLLAFPNVLQHQVQPFKLADPTRSGHRKILAMFLIDPHIPILSTANVPPQRKDWWAQEVRQVPKFAELPQELFEMIVDAVEDFPISWDEAERIRLELMDERGLSNQDLEEKMEQDTFYFCEH
ncbi:hypothetical protein CC78DRAFT_557965 [Lojkania enalia]|uniref:Duf1665 domain containing protein n=1 Tax=Lojkania enalia TaxID=147567 RepID=A0A9P4TNJ5_9PLEO|nr:hypothetical protein CC78DRAFT_557965 [Didymosphaeria enalia]